MVINDQGYHHRGNDHDVSITRLSKQASLLKQTKSGELSNEKPFKSSEI